MTRTRLRWLFLFFCFAPAALSAQEAGDGRFGCFDMETTSGQLIRKPELRFVAITNPAAIQVWKSRPVRSFGGFDSAKYGWKQVDFYLGHEKTVPQMQGPFEVEGQKIIAAIRVIGSSGEKWFELKAFESKDHPDEADLLQVARKPDDSPETPVAEAAETAPAAKEKPNEDPAAEIAKWIHVQFAVPGPNIPVFVLRYLDFGQGDSSNFTASKELLVDARGGNPEVAAAGECAATEVTRGTCGNIASAYQQLEKTSCSWDSSADDFHCKAKSAFGGDASYRTAQRDFYLMSGKPANPEWAAGAPPDLGAWAVSIGAKGTKPLQTAMIPGLGATTFLARYRDLLPQAEVLLFASPGASEMLNAQLSMVIVTAEGKPDVQVVEKWDIGGEEERKVIGESLGEEPGILTPIGEADEYRVRALEDRAGFHAVQATMTWQGSHFEKSGVTRVLYWIGLEAVSGKIVANAVRLASEGQILSGCNDFLDDATATSIRIKPSVAEAAVRVQPRTQAELEEGQTASCQWNGVVHWKAGAGFRVRRVSEDCKAAPRTISISEDGTIKAAGSN